MFKKKKPIEHTIEKQAITLGVVIDGEVVDTFAVNSPRLASLFLNNPTFIDLEEKK
jgi:hypothetical protein